MGQSCCVIYSSPLEDATWVVKDTVVEGSEGDTEGEVVDAATEVGAAAVCLQVEAVSQSKVDYLEVHGE